MLHYTLMSSRLSCSPVYSSFLLFLCLVPGVAYSELRPFSFEAQSSRALRARGLLGLGGRIPRRGCESDCLSPKCVIIQPVLLGDPPDLLHLSHGSLETVKRRSTSQLLSLRAADSEEPIAACPGGGIAARRPNGEVEHRKRVTAPGKKD
ncbi:unnamed protein product [Pleuronectes platessa]|uniref:Uncharacterized protein n=1 Tax=Pleuronectes platessa TaxID=8262 RepID=A0A9N7VJ92_PLEPL|nr:unnamed protein product [Pleuronectes platessa]